jgi:dUTP pyrophosphatase
MSENSTISKVIPIKIQKLVPEAYLPVYSTQHAACFDLFSANKNPQTLRPGSTVVIDTGLAFEIPEGHVMLIFSRSGHGFKNNIRLSNAVGVIDADYRGAVKVKLAADDMGDWNAGLCVEYGDRIAQGMVIPFPEVSFILTEELSSTERGAGGFGSTGK